MHSAYAMLAFVWIIRIFHVFQREFVTLSDTESDGRIV